MGEIYPAKDTKLGRLAAIKFLPASSASDETARRRLVREVSHVAVTGSDA